MKIAIAGAGAMGGRFGTMLAQTDNPVTFIDLWADHVQAINQHGLLVHTDNGDQRVHVPAYLPQNVPGTFDLIVLFTKAMGIADMLTALKPVITPQTHILELGNGIGNIETISRFVPKEQIIAGVTVWSAALNGPGEITMKGDGSVTLEALGSNEAPFFKQVVQVLTDAGLKPTASHDVLAAIWRKAALNSVLNTYCTILDCNIGEFGQLPDHDAMIDGVLGEFAAIAANQHVHFDAAGAKQLIIAQFPDDKNGLHYPSMHQDMAKGRKTEIDFLNGYIAKVGARENIPTPVNATLTALIHGQEKLKTLHSREAVTA
ncbi:ketopantoate reductase family protein [Schleiferilactobacillus shenzhenensis]|uniref:ketopantoate reductase family protein n=1 Tax=Schleiferilactobacillus shenzhenensis TaxID=1231337 RepID=UPI00058C6182|nr:ketopantoate reductase family protein [Schleiferilactobacillus shenzhenensis]